MKRKNLFTSAVIIATALTLSTGLSGCGKQEVEPVMAATVEEVTPTSEITTEESVTVATEEETESSQESTVEETETESATQDYEITEMNVEMQATQNAMTYENPNGEIEVSGVRKDEVIEVIGKVDNTEWYQIDQEGFKSFIDGSYLKALEQQQPAEQQQQSQPTQQQQQPQEQQQQQQQPEVQQPQQPEVTPPPANIPAGAEVTDDGTVYMPGDYDPVTDSTYVGNTDELFKGMTWE